MEMKKNNPKENKNNLNPGLEDIGYEADPFNLSQRLKREPTRDPKTNALKMNALPEEMSRGDGWKALGEYQPSAHQWKQDCFDDDYIHTHHHEKGHAKGASTEYMAEAYADKNYCLD